MASARRQPTVVDLFAGAGGFSLGFRAAGCRILAAVDHDEVSAETFAVNLGRLQSKKPRVLGGDEGNLEELDLSAIVGGQTPDLLIGGPPCQGFSRIGRGKLASLSDEGFAGDPRNELYLRFRDAARLWKPLAFVMENVPGMLSVEGENIADAVAGDLAECGYRVGYAVLNAAWYGVPQYRERLFFVGLRNDLGLKPRMPRATHRPLVPAGYSLTSSSRQPETLTFDFIPHHEIDVEHAGAHLPATTVADALDDLPPLLGHLSPTAAGVRRTFRRVRKRERVPQSLYAKLMRSWPGRAAPATHDDHVMRRTPRDYEIFRQMKPGDRYPDAAAIAERLFLDELARREALGTAPDTESPAWSELRKRYVPPYPVDAFVDKWRKLVPHQPSWTVVAHLSKDGYSHIHHDSSQARSISVREAARLQSFPDAFAFVGNMGECYRQIGNAVPPLLAWAIAADLIEQLGFRARPIRWSRSCVTTEE